MRRQTAFSKGEFIRQGLVRRDKCQCYLQNSRNFHFKISTVVDDVDVRMSDPYIACFFVELPSYLDSFGARRVVLESVELLSTFGGRYHVNDLIIPIVAEIDLRLTPGLDLFIIGYRLGCSLHSTSNSGFSRFPSDLGPNMQRGP